MRAFQLEISAPGKNRTPKTRNSRVTNNLKIDFFSFTLPFLPPAGRYHDTKRQINFVSCSSLTAHQKDHTLRVNTVCMGLTLSLPHLLRIRTGPSHRQTHPETYTHVSLADEYLATRRVERWGGRAGLGFSSGEFPLLPQDTKTLGKPQRNGEREGFLQNSRHQYSAFPSGRDLTALRYPNFLFSPLFNFTFRRLGTPLFS